MSDELFVLLPVAFIAGIINAAVGGGGLITMPTFYSTLPHFTPAEIMGIDKCSSVMGHLMSIRQFMSRLRLPWALILPTALSAILGAYTGIRLLDFMPSDWMRPLVIVVLAIMVVYTWLKPQFGHNDTSKEPDKADLIKGMVLGFVIGFYDGFIGPGTGSFLLFLFIRFFHFDFLRATASAKVVNFGTNFSTLFFLIPNGLIHYDIAIPLGISAILGSLVGVRIALRGGNVWIRRLFLLLAGTLLVKLLWETLH